mmetsp:Transcript_52339/g.86636  ORF Transcript_52339/g.86636 Transcript_52339/m.86636 type:complete len:366 (+) Transcript_52339:412-1509(+)
MSFWSSAKSVASLMFGSNKYDGENLWTDKMGKFTDMEAVDIEGNNLAFNTFDGKVLIITNAACKCGYTKPSYDALQALSEKYYDRGLRVLLFPCNQFMGQEPWPEKEIQDWVNGKWPNIKPVMFSKIDVNGDQTHKVYKFLKTAFPGDITWNFSTKFVVGSDGIPTRRFDKNQSWTEIEAHLVAQLDKRSSTTQPLPPKSAGKNNEDVVDEKQSGGDDVNEIQASLDNLQLKDSTVQQQLNDMQSELTKYADAAVVSDANAPFDAASFVEELVQSARVVMISKSYCPFCTKAASVLMKYDADLIKKEIDIDLKEEQANAVQAYLKQKTGASSVPRVFIHGTFIGGCDDTQQLDRDDKLKAMIEAQ